jgi:transposase-like protein
VYDTVWLYFWFPLTLRMVEEMLAARGISVTYEVVVTESPKHLWPRRSPVIPEA